LLEGCAFFLLDWLIEGRGGYLETNPSTSPEHDFVAPDGKPASVSYSSTMDMAIIKEIFSAVVSAAEVKFLFYTCQTIFIFLYSISLYPNRFFDSSFWGGGRILLLKECARLYQGFIQQKLQEMVALWNGYVSGLIIKRCCFGVGNEVCLYNGITNSVFFKTGTGF
jgi:hypothetical protein